MIAFVVVLAMGGAVLFLNKATRRAPPVVVEVQAQPTALEVPVVPAPHTLDVESGAPGAVPGAHSSCADAFARYVAAHATSEGPPIPEGELAKVLNDGNYLEPCAVSPALTVNVCAAIRNGTAVGVTVSTTPVSPAVEACVAEQIRALQFPRYAQMQLRTATFRPLSAGAAQPSALVPRPQLLLPPVPAAPTPAAPPPEEPYID